MTKLQNLLKGLIKENPVLVLVLGTCPTLAISTSVTAAFGMGIAATVVLILSNMAISALRKVIPDTVRIPCYITVIAGFVTIVELVMEAYTYELYQSLGVYLALIVVNCIILGRAEMYANKHGVVDSAIDGLGMGLGFTLALCAMATIREILGAGTFCGMPIPWFQRQPHRHSYHGARRLLRVRLHDRAGQQDHPRQGNYQEGIRLCGMPGLRQGRLLQREGGKRLK